MRDGLVEYALVFDPYEIVNFDKAYPFLPQINDQSFDNYFKRIDNLYEEKTFYYN